MSVAGARPEPVPFGARLGAAMDELGPLCVGIDPHPALLAGWDLSDDAEGVRELGLRVVEALGGRVAALKPQAAFFERHGSRGVAALEEVIAAARSAGTLTIVDAKRGDIGSTMAGYAEAFLADGSPLAGDAVTLSPYLGFGSLAPAADLAAVTGRGIFVLCLTSNPEGPEVQHAVGPDGVSVAANIAARAADLNADAVAAGHPMGAVGLVVGATVADAVRRTGTDLEAVAGPLLAPGVGAQGAGQRALADVFGAVRRHVLASSSRGVLSAGPDATALRAAAQRSTAEVRAALRPSG